MNFTYKKWWFQVGLWSFTFLFFFILTNHFQGYKYSLVSATFTTSCLFFAHYISTRFLIPVFNQNIKHYLLISTLVILILTILTSSIEIFIIDKFRILTHKAPPIIFHYIRQFMILVLVFFVDTSFSLMEQTVKLKENEKMLNEEKLETELKLLKAQINPHFIFNALNNIYSLSYMQSNKAPESVLKLSEMLRYVFYDCSKDHVSLSGEIKYIKNFIAFQQMKSESPQNIVIRTELQDKMPEVAPMLMISFIENAFKYSRIEEYSNANVSIDIEQNDHQLNFKIENSVPIDNKPMAGSGMGIKNVQHRLNIIYPEKHTLKINDNGTHFTVILSIKLVEHNIHKKKTLQLKRNRL